MTPSKTHKKNLRLTALAVAVALSVAACGGKDDAAQQDGAAKGGQQQQQGGKQQLPVVGVLTVQPSTATISNDLPARLESRRSAEVRAQVGGIIKKRLFNEGSYVKAGQALYQVDDATYQAALESARAQLASAEATLAKANADVARYRPLVQADAVSKQEFDAAVAAQRAGKAGVKSAKAAIRSAQINVNYSRITAPISGYIGQALVSEGTLVNAGDTTSLARIQQTDPMYVNITQSAGAVMKMKQQIAEGKIQSVEGTVPVTVLLEDGSEYTHQGRLIFADPTVNESTGQVTIRAEVPNPDNVLMPGLYVRVKLPQANIANSFAIPQQAVTRGQKDTVMIVGADGMMTPREVTVSGQEGSNWIITAGLKAGDKVVVDGTMIAGMAGAKSGNFKVSTKEWQPPKQQAPAGSTVPAAASAAQPVPAAKPASAAQPAAASATKTSDAKSK